MPRTPHRPPAAVAASLFVGLTAYAAVLWLKWPALEFAHPYGDDFSLLAQSATPSWSWLTSGFSRYFAAYPEYFEPFTNFIRPVDNAFYSAFSCAGCFRWQLVVMNCGVLAASTGGLYFLSRRLGNGQLVSTALSACALLAPGFWGTPMASTPAYGFDAVVALQSLVAVWLASRSQWGPALAVLALAVLTKESALPVVGVFACYALAARRHAVAVGAVLIIGTWALLRFLAFGSSVGVYAVATPLSWQDIPFRLSLGLWLPVAYSNAIPFRAMLGGAIASPAALIVIANAIALMSGALAAASGVREATHSESREDRLVVLKLAAPAAVASGVFFLAVGGVTRFSYVFYTLFLVVLTAAGAGVWRNLSLGLVAAGALSSALLFSAEAERQRPVDRFRQTAARQLMVALRSQSSPRPIYVVNDFVSGHSTMANVLAVAGATTVAERGSSIGLGTCGVTEVRSIRSAVVTTPGGDLSLTTTLPACAEFLFEGASARELVRHLDGTHLTRSEAIAYDFPQVALASSGQAGATRIATFGSVMTLTVRHSAVLYYDFEKGDWTFVPSQ